MIKGNDKLSNIQLSSLIASTIIGVAVLTLPKTASQSAGEGAILSTLMGGLVATLMAVLIAVIGKHFYRQTIIEYSISILGKILGKTLGGFLVVYIILFCSIVLRNFSDTLKGFMLRNTPVEVIMISMLLVSVYLILNGISAITKISEAFLPIIIIALLLVISLSYKDFSMDRIRPMFTPTFGSALRGVPNLFFAFQGYEILFFVIPFMADHKKVIPSTLVGMTIPVILYILIAIMAIGVFGLETTQQLNYPIITLAKNIAFPGSFAERFDVFFVILWILAAFTTVCNVYYMASLGAVRLFGLKNYRPFVFILLPIIYVMAIFPQNLFEIRYANLLIGYLGMGIAFISILLGTIVWIKRIKGEIRRD